MQTEIKAPFTRDRINLGPIPDWVQIGFAFTRDLLEPVRCCPLTRYDVGLLEERSKYRPRPVQASCKQARPIPLWIRFAFHAQQPKCTCNSRFLQWPNLSINTLWPASFTGARSLSPGDRVSEGNERPPENELQMAAITFMQYSPSQRPF